MNSTEKVQVEVKFKFQTGLTYALRQIKDDVFNSQRTRIAHEFWHSLNRKGLVENAEVEPLIEKTLQDF